MKNHLKKIKKLLQRHFMKWVFRIKHIAKLSSLKERVEITIFIYN